MFIANGDFSQTGSQKTCIYKTDLSGMNQNGWGVRPRGTAPGRFGQGAQPLQVRAKIRILLGRIYKGHGLSC